MNQKNRAQGGLLQSVVKRQVSQFFSTGARSFYRSVRETFCGIGTMKENDSNSKRGKRVFFRYESLEERCVLSGYPLAPEGSGNDGEFEANAHIPVYVDGEFTFGDLNAQFPFGKDNTFDLESNPNATKTIYLDFDGHHSVNNFWNHDIVFPAFDTDGDVNSFSDAELSQIQKQFLHVVEDFLPFEINVTTKFPGLDALTKSGNGDDTWGTRAVNTQYTDGFGNGTGGIAHLNSFSAAIDDPVFTFNKGVNAGGMTNSHEVGHALGLRHDGLNGSTYHPGVGTGETSWGPIMGAPFGKNVVQWSQGEYTGATNFEDDLAVITKAANGVQFVGDDHGDTRLNATLLDVQGDVNVSGWGIISTRTDNDVFSFATGAGSVVINVDALTQNPNLDVEATLIDSAGQVVAVSNPAGSVSASFNLTLEKGTYFISVDGVGKAGVYNDYGSLGYFEIDGVVVDPINDLPTLDELSDMVIPEDSGTQTVQLLRITAGPNESQPLRVTASSNNPWLIPNPSVEYVSPQPVGSLEFAPNPGRNGTADITVVVEDGGNDQDLSTAGDNAFFSRTFTVIVTPDNDAPTIDSISDVSVDEDSGARQIFFSGVTDGDEGLQPLKVSVVSDNPSVIPHPTVNYNSPASGGSLTFTPIADQHGASIIWVRVEDGGLDEDLSTTSDNAVSIESFVITVNPINDRPTLNALNDIQIDEDEFVMIDLGGITAGGGEIQPLRIFATSDNQSLIVDPVVNYTSDETIGSIEFQPNLEQFGTATISVIVEDGGLDEDLSTSIDNRFFERTFGVIVTERNDEPTINPINDIRIDEDASVQMIELRGLSAGSIEDQPFIVTATSTHSGLLGELVVDHESPNEIGRLSFTPVPNQFGSAEVTVTVEDGGLDGNLQTKADNASTTATFVVTVDPINDVPEFMIPSSIQFDRFKIDNLVEILDISPGPIETEPLRVTATITNPELMNGVVVDYTNPDSTGTLTFSAIAREIGTAQIFVTVEDGGLDGDLTTSGDNALVTKVIDVAVTSNNVSYATTDSTNHGLIEGTYGDTYWPNVSSQSITETAYRNGTRSRLSHRWNFDLPGGENGTQFFVYAAHSSSNEQFVFEYKVAGSSWQHLLTTTQNARRKYSVNLDDPALNAGGNVLVRVRDSNRGNDSELATITIDKLNFLNRRTTEIKDAVNIFAYDAVATSGGGDKAQFRIQLADRTRLEQDLVVRYEVSGTASENDYRETLTGTKIIKAGNLTARIMITPRGDLRRFEGAESLSIRILDSEDYIVTGDPMATIKIRDDSMTTFEAEAEVSELGRHRVNYQQSYYMDGNPEILSEKLVGERTVLDHLWRFDVKGETDLRFEGKFQLLKDPYVDSFKVVYSTDRETWNSLGELTTNSGMIEIEKTVTVPQDAENVWVRVYDLFRNNRDSSVTRIAVHQLRFVVPQDNGVSLQSIVTSSSSARVIGNSQSSLPRVASQSQSDLFDGHMQNQILEQEEKNELFKDLRYGNEEEESAVAAAIGSWDDDPFMTF